MWRHHVCCFIFYTENVFIALASKGSGYQPKLNYKYHITEQHYPNYHKWSKILYIEWIKSMSMSNFLHCTPKHSHRLYYTDHQLLLPFSLSADLYMLIHIWGVSHEVPLCSFGHLCHHRACSWGEEEPFHAVEAEGDTKRQLEGDKHKNTHQPN